MIVALGESILVTGATLSYHDPCNAPTLILFFVAFRGSHGIAHSLDPSRMCGYFHYKNAIMLGGVIVSAVANELVIAHPDDHINTTG